MQNLPVVGWRQLIEKMKTVNIPDLTCPRCNSKAELVNRYSRRLRRNMLLLYCGNCKNTTRYKEKKEKNSV
jgi:transcription elongation factor Elf1